ncbi:MAG: hypothetical protein ABI311_04835 [Gemmatimonadaceae bacterium]
MLSQSNTRLLGARSVLIGLVTLAILLAVVAIPASGASVMMSRGHRSDSGNASVTSLLSKFSPLAADTTLDTGAVIRSPRARGGYMVTEDQLANEQDFPLGSVLIAHFPGIRVVPGSSGDRVASRLNIDMTGSPCYLQIFVNGVYLADGGIDWVNVRDLAAIEYRTPGNVPVQYQNRLPGAMCGVLLLWSKNS